MEDMCLFLASVPAERNGGIGRRPSLTQGLRHLAHCQAAQASA